MKPLLRHLALFSSIALLGCAHLPLAPAPGPAPVLSQTHLRSPWEAAPVALTTQPYNCPPLAPISPDILVTNGVGAQKKVSDTVQQAVYAESDAALHELSARSVAAADNFRHTGSQAAARCVIILLSNAAADHSMAGYMATADAAQEQNLALCSVAIAYLKVRDSGLATPDEADLIGAWMEDIARQERNRIESTACGKTYCELKAHEGLSIAMASAAVGVAANDPSMLHWAIAQYRTAVAGIDGRGMLHFDTHGAYALKFNLLSAAALVQIAEFAETNGEPLYAYDGGRIHLLIRTVSRGLIDPGPYVSAAGIEQHLPSSLEPWQVIWAAVYNRRFPDPVLTGLLQQIGPRGDDMWGGEPIDGA